jgi:hypothetical protein
VLPDHYFAAQRHRECPTAPKKRLMFRRASRCHRGNSGQRESTRAGEAEFWIRDEADEGVFLVQQRVRRARLRTDVVSREKRCSHGGRGSRKRAPLPASADDLGSE